MLGLVIEDVANPFYSAIARGVEEATRERGLLLITGSSDEDPERERELVLLFRERRVDGLLIVPAGDDHGYLVPGARGGIHVVFIDRPPGNIDADAVLLDNAGGARAATEHLLRRGHRRVAMVVDEMTIFTQRERLARLLRRARRRRAYRRRRLVRLQRPRRGRRQSRSPASCFRCPARRRRSSPPNNRITIGVLRALAAAPRRRRGGRLRRPRAGGLLARPPTTVSYDAADLGREAAGLLTGRLEGDAARRSA